MDAYQTLEVVEAGNVTIARLREQRISDGDALRLLLQELTALVAEEGRDRFLINLGSVEYLSSSAIGALIAVRKKARSRSGVVKLCNLQPDIHTMFTITRMDQLFDIETSEDDALSAFCGG